MHSEMFARAMDAAGLDSAYGVYVDDASAEVLAVNNAMSLFGLHRRLRGACMGHLAAFEMTSSFPSRRYAMGAERLGFTPDVAAYFDEHVEGGSQIVLELNVTGFVRENGFELFRGKLVAELFRQEEDRPDNSEDAGFDCCGGDEYGGGEIQICRSSVECPRADRMPPEEPANQQEKTACNPDKGEQCCPGKSCMCRRRSVGG